MHHAILFDYLFTDLLCFINAYFPHPQSTVESQNEIEESQYLI